MSEFRIRQFREFDLAFSAELNKGENWTDTHSDITRLLQCEPQGFVIAERQGKPVGQAFAISYGRLGWIGYLIVAKQHRRQGIGSALIAECIAYLRKRQVETIYLEANPRAANLYQKMGFETQYKTWKFLKLNQNTEIPSFSSVSIMSESDLSDVHCLDKDFFMADRSKIIDGIWTDNPSSCFVASEKAELKGYAMVRPMRKGSRIGPFVCDPSYTEIAEGLLVNAINAIPKGTSLSLSVPDLNTAWLGLLSRYGFERMSPNMRMCLGKRQPSQPAMGIFALGGLEKA
jgi:ribosomal protein S18 acetylase RimI-like enzyme